MVEKKIKENPEIDLIEVIIIILKHKWKVFSIMFLFIILGLIYSSMQEPVISKYEAKTEIRSISSFDEFEYEVYNNYLSKSGPKVVQYPIKIDNETFMINEIDMEVDHSYFKKIDKEYLIKLFIEKINENEFLLSTMKEFGLLNKENYSNSLEYETALMKFADSFKLFPNSKELQKDEYIEDYSWIIKFKTQNVKNWEKYLIFLEKRTNDTIRDYLNKSFSNLLSNQAKMKGYKIEDIDVEIENEKNKDKLNRLLTNRQKLLEEKDVDRLKFSFETTPIVNSDKFYAASLLHESTEYKNISQQRRSSSSIIILSTIFGLILGIFFVLILNLIQQRK